MRVVIVTHNCLLLLLVNYNKINILVSYCILPPKIILLEYHGTLKCKQLSKLRFELYAPCSEESERRRRDEQLFLVHKGPTI